MTKKLHTFFLFFFLVITINAQTIHETGQSNLSEHFQMTVISQSHSGFSVPYKGRNSLADSTEVSATSLTATLFLGKKLWKGASVYFNPELSGGAGLSYSVGIAGALNGETYRIGDPEPKVSIARAYLQQTFPFGKSADVEVNDDVNQVKDKLPENRLTITVGKFAISDFYDKNIYSHDPRNQFFNWSLMSNGAWDYPANTKGYTFGVVVELIKPSWTIRLSSVAEPRSANQSEMEYSFAHVHSESFEFEKNWSINKHGGAARFLLTNTFSRAPSYSDGLKAITSNDIHLLNVFNGTEENNGFGGTKFGIGFNGSQELTNDIGLFARAGWNDGKHATWTFTEIDQTVCAGLSVKGSKWHRSQDVCGIAGVINGISHEHQEFLKAGGSGFIIGDGNLNYGTEKVLEAYYNVKLTNTLWLTTDYQLVTNPGYNKDRKGPVHVFGIRGHIQF